MNEILERVKKYPKGSEEMVNSYEYNEGVRGAWTPIWVRNSHENYTEVKRRFQLGNFDLASLRGTMKPGPCLILGSGPSLEDAKPYLKDWKGTIFCSTSHLPMFAYMGLEPDYCCLIDCDPNMVFLVSEYYKKSWKTIFLTHPQIPHDYFRHMADDKVYFFRMLDPSDEFSAKFLPLAYGWLNEEKNWSIGSTILNGGNVVNTMIPMVQAYGWRPIFLMGYDQSYPDGLRRSGDYRKKPDGSWEIIPPLPLTEQRWVEAVKLVSNNGVPMDELNAFYKTSSIIMSGMSSPPIISCSRGIMTEWPYVPAQEVIEKQGMGFEHLIVNPVDAYKIAQAYLRPRGFLILKTDFWASVQNTKGMKPLDKVKHLLDYEWYIRKPWKWMGGKGYMPHRIKKMQRKAKKEEAAKKAKEVASVPR